MGDTGESRGLPMARVTRAGGAGLLALTLWLPGAAMVKAEAGASPATLLAPEAGRVLVAAPSLPDANFSHTVVLLLDYGEHGAMGVVVNRRSQVPLRAVLPRVDELAAREDEVFLGGPVGRERLLVLVRDPRPTATMRHLFGALYASGSLEVLRTAILEQWEFRAYAGYAGWAAGQLEAEIARGDWWVDVADEAQVFDRAPSRMWQRLNRRHAGTWVRAPAQPVVQARDGFPQAAPRWCA